MPTKPASRPAPRKELDAAGRLLDAAERLFGRHGYDGVGVRKLTKEARVNLGAVTYHFGSKEALYVETFMRRFRPTEIERRRLLQEAKAEAKDQPVPVEQIVDCMVRPPYQLGLKHPDFFTLLERNFSAPPSCLIAALHREFAPNMKLCEQALRRSLPNVPEDLLRLRVMFSLAALHASPRRFAKIRPGQNPKFHEGILRELVRFIAAGLQSEPAVPAAERPPIPCLDKPPRG